MRSFSTLPGNSAAGRGCNATQGQQRHLQDRTISGGRCKRARFDGKQSKAKCSMLAVQQQVAQECNLYRWHRMCPYGKQTLPVANQHCMCLVAGNRYCATLMHLTAWVPVLIACKGLNSLPGNRLESVWSCCCSNMCKQKIRFSRLFTALWHNKSRALHCNTPRSTSASHVAPDVVDMNLTRSGGNMAGPSTSRWPCCCSPCLWLLESLMPIFEHEGAMLRCYARRQTTRNSLAVSKDCCACAALKQAKTGTTQ